MVGALLFILPCSLALGSRHVISLGAGSTDLDHAARARSLDSEERGNITALIARSIQGVQNKEILSAVEDGGEQQLIPFPLALEGVPRQARTDGRRVPL